MVVDTGPEPDLMHDCLDRLEVESVPSARGGLGGRRQRLRHPSAETLAPLEAAGLEVLRTGVDGDSAVIADADGELRVATRQG